MVEGQAVSSDDERISEIRDIHVAGVGIGAHVCANCYDEWPCDTAYLLARVDALTAENETAWQTLARERDSWQTEADTLTAERDALSARLAASEAALPDPGKLWSLATWLDSVYPYDSNPEVQTDLRTWAKAIVATGAHPGAWVREVVEDSAALAASSAEGEG